jgi:hypothetical protein
LEIIEKGTFSKGKMGGKYGHHSFYIPEMPTEN